MNLTIFVKLIFVRVRSEYKKPIGSLLIFMRTLIHNENRVYVSPQVSVNEILFTR